jgi:Inner membrane component of T3SS, cytoplasmic domain
VDGKEERTAGYVLEIVEGPEAGRSIELGGAPVEIGREEGVDVVLGADELVSRHHVRLTPDVGGVVVEDLGSQNGTFVNGDEIVGPARLQPGGQLQVGVTVLELSAADGSSGTALTPIPEAFEELRPEPGDAAKPLAVSERRPDYVSPDAAPQRGDTPLSGLLDVHTKSQARHAPLALFVIVAVLVMIALAVR